MNDGEIPPRVKTLTRCRWDLLPPGSLCAAARPRLHPGHELASPSSSHHRTSATPSRSRRTQDRTSRHCDAPLITLSPRACHSDRLVSELLLTALTCQQAQLGVHTGVADVFTPVFTPAFTPESPAIHTLTWHSFTPQFTPHRRRREHVFTAPVCSHRSRRRSGIAELTSHIVPTETPTPRPAHTRQES